jgi:predicted DNA binding CopG/RHH family protein
MNPPRMTPEQAIAAIAAMTDADFPTISRDEEPDETLIGRLVDAGRRGRPSLSEPGATSPQITLRLPAQADQTLRNRAAAEGVSVSRYARRILVDALAS